MNILHRLHVWLQQHSISCFILMTVSFVLFGCMSFDLIRLVTANADYLSSYGLLAFQEGGLQQFFELWLKAFATMIFWVIFKVCEGNLVDAIAKETVDS